MGLWADLTRLQSRLSLTIGVWGGGNSGQAGVPLEGGGEHTISPQHEVRHHPDVRVLLHQGLAAPPGGGV